MKTFSKILFLQMFLFVIFSGVMFFSFQKKVLADNFEEYAHNWLTAYHINDDSINRQAFNILKYKLNLDDNTIAKEFQEIYGKDNIEKVKNDPKYSHLTSGSTFRKKIANAPDDQLQTTNGKWTVDGIISPTLKFQPKGKKDKITSKLSEEDKRKFIQDYAKTKKEGQAKAGELPALEVNYQNPLSVNSFTELIGNFLAKLQGIIGWLAVIMLVIGGIVYITATGRSAQIELGKKIITFALIGFAIAVAAPSILKEIVELAKSGQGGGSSDVIKNAKPIKAIVESVLLFIITLLGIVATIGFTISGVLFITATGDTGKADKARKGLFYSIVGVVIAGASLIVVKQIFSLIAG